MKNEKIETFASAIVDSKDLADALKFTRHSLAKHALQTDGCYFLEFTPGYLHIITNDYRSATRTILEVQNVDGLTAGNIFLSNALVAFLGVCSHQPLKIELCGKLTSVAAELMKYVKVTTAEGEYQFDSPFPHIIESPYKVFDNKKVVATIDSYSFLAALAFASAAKKKDNSDEEIKGNVCLRLTKKKFSVTATDGFRVHRYSSKHDSEEVKEGSYLIDGKAVQILSDFLKRNDNEKVWLTTSESFLILQADSDEVLLRLYDAKFPDTDSIFSKASPENYNVGVQIGISNLVNAAKRVSIFKDDMNQCRLQIDSTKEEVTMTDINGKATEKFSVSSNGYSKDLNIRLNVGHLLSACTAMNADEIYFKGKGPSDFVILSNNDPEEKMEALLMPFSS